MVAGNHRIGSVEIIIRLRRHEFDFEQFIGSGVLWLENLYQTSLFGNDFGTESEILINSEVVVRVIARTGKGYISAAAEACR